MDWKIAGLLLEAGVVIAAILGIAYLRGYRVGRQCPHCQSHFTDSIRRWVQSGVVKGGHTGTLYEYGECYRCDEDWEAEEEEIRYI